MPYSSQTGLASLWLGRWLLRAGDRVGGRDALEAAITSVIQTGAARTVDMGGTDGTRAMAEAVAERL